MAKSPDGSNVWLASRLMADAELLDNNIVTEKKNLVYSWFLYVYFVRQYVTKLRCPITAESLTLFIKEKYITYMHLQSITLQYVFSKTIMDS